MEANCLICGDILKLRKHNVFNTFSDHSQTYLYELIQKALGFELDLALFETEEEKELVCLCESCYGKINNYDLGLTLSGKAQRELEQLLEEKIKKQEVVENALKIENVDPIKKETNDDEGPFEEEMEEEYLIEYDKDAFDVDQIEVRETSESEGETITEPSHEKVSRPRVRKFSRGFEKGRFYCNMCNAGYTTQEALDFHVEKHRNAGVNECPECHKKFAQKSALSRHMPMHTGEQPYQCAICGKRFIHYSSFNMHMLIHDDVRLKKCKICGMALRSSSHLNRHMRVHTGEKPYTCPTCGQKFAQRYNMNAHMKGHQGIKRVSAKITQCPLCDATFKVKGKLKEHISEVHGQTVAVVEPTNTDSDNGEGWVIIKDSEPKECDGLKVEGVALLS